ncbi:MAG: lysophospholipid acyltransferase family protein [Prolixibacteraceae bacterium]|nr:lysophospholipid acyltransferase family protein [Prolixibacteraceae bacterium]
MKRLFASTGIFILKVLGYTPFWLLYICADLIYLISYYVVGYRKKTVRRNLKNSFPEKTDQEIHRITIAFYRHFADLVVETIKSFQISEETLQKRISYKNPEVLDELYAQGKSVALLSGHYGNWEWTMAMPKFIQHQLNVIYRPMQNKQIDTFMKKVRSRFGMFLIPAQTSLRTMLEIEKSGQLSATYYLADQTALYDTKYWMMFLNQETPVFPGPEKVASRLKQAVVFMDIQKVRRGYYEVEFTKLFDDASQTKEFEVTKTHVNFLEEIIRKRPEFWLWSHKRWKHTRPEYIALQ